MLVFVAFKHCRGEAGAYQLRPLVPGLSPSFRIEQIGGRGVTPWSGMPRSFLTEPDMGIMASIKGDSHLIQTTSFILECTRYGGRAA